jgi:hypothetical protein
MEDFAPGYAHLVYACIYDMLMEGTQHIIRFIDYGGDPGNPLVSMLRTRDPEHYRLLHPKEKQESR